MWIVQVPKSSGIGTTSYARCNMGNSQRNSNTQHWALKRNQTIRARSKCSKSVGSAASCDGDTVPLAMRVLLRHLQALDPWSWDSPREDWEGYRMVKVCEDLILYNHIQSHTHSLIHFIHYSIGVTKNLGCIWMYHANVIRWHHVAPNSKMCWPDSPNAAKLATSRNGAAECRRRHRRPLHIQNPSLDRLTK